MRVAIFTDTFVPEVNGVAKTLERWRGYLTGLGIPCKVFAPESPPSLVQAGSPLDVERYPSLPFFLYPECRLALPNLMGLRKSLHQFRPTLIHVATPFNLGLCGIHYAKKHGIPLVASYHTNFDHYLPFYNLSGMEKILWRYMDWFHRDCQAIFAPSETTRGMLEKRGWEPSRLKIWSRGIDSAAFHPLVDRNEFLRRQGLEQCPFLALYAGRLSPEKDVETAIKAFAAFQHKQCPDAVLVLAGDGPSAGELNELCDKLGVNARFVGFAGMAELQRWYASSDVFLFPSPTETFGNVVLESMACGTPVICANAGGVTDIVEHGHTGFLCQPGDVEAFSGRLGELHQNASLLIKMGQESLSYSKSRTWDGVMKGLLDEYKLINFNSTPFIKAICAKNAENG